MNDGTEEDKNNSLVSAALPSVAVNTQTALEAYDLVLKNVGAVLPARDTLDERIINDVKNRRGKIIDVQGGFEHGTEYNLTVNAWPNLRSVPAAIDTDKDGMPDNWERTHGLNETDAGDASTYKLDKNYSNIEVYLNSLVR